MINLIVISYLGLSVQIVCQLIIPSILKNCKWES